MQKQQGKGKLNVKDLVHRQLKLTKVKIFFVKQERDIFTLTTLQYSLVSQLLLGQAGFENLKY